MNWYAINITDWKFLVFFLGSIIKVASKGARLKPVRGAR